MAPAGQRAADAEGGAVDAQSAEAAQQGNGPFADPALFGQTGAVLGATPGDLRAPGPACGTCRGRSRHDTWGTTAREKPGARRAGDRATTSCRPLSHAGLLPLGQAPPAGHARTRSPVIQPTIDQESQFRCSSALFPLGLVTLICPSARSGRRHGPPVKPRPARSCCCSGRAPRGAVTLRTGFSLPGS